MNISETLTVNDTIAETLAFGDFNATPQAQSLAGYTLPNGTALGQVDLHYESAEITLAASGTTTLTLSALVDGLGRTVAFARVVKYQVLITSRVDGDYVTAGGAGTHPWAAVETHKVYDLELKVANTTAGLVVTPGSSDQLLFTNSSGTNPIKFKLKLSGRSV
jgi:hypothetical protein